MKSMRESLRASWARLPDGPAKRSVARRVRRLRTAVECGWARLWRWRETRCLFVLSTGRVGTMSLAELLDLSPDVEGIHEPLPQPFSESKAAFYRIGNAGDAFASVVERMRALPLARTRRRGHLYAETSHRWTFLAPVMADLLPHARFLHLYRHPAAVVRSGMRRGWYRDHVGDPDRIEPGPGDPASASWPRWDQFARLCWYWGTVNRAASAFTEDMGPGRARALSFEELYRPDAQALMSLYDWLGVARPAMERVRAVVATSFNEQTSGTFPDLDEWTEDQIQTLYRIAGATIERLGYGDVKGLRREAVDTSAQPPAGGRNAGRRPRDAAMLEHPPAITHRATGRAPRILYTCHGAGLGGGEFRMLDHIRHSRFGPAAFRVLLFTHGELEGRLRELDVPFDVLDAERLDHGGPAWLTIGRALSRYTPNLMICNTYRDLLLAGPAAALLKIPILWRSRADFFPSLDEKAWWRRQMFLLFLEHRVARTLCTTEYDRQLILRHGVPDRNVHTLYNGVDTRLFAGAGALRGAVRAEFGLDERDPVVGFIARMVPQKGHLDFLQAIARVKRVVSNVRALIVGDTTQLYGRPEYKAAVLRLVDELDLSGTVVFAGYRDDIAPIMNAVDVFASASLVEPFGTTTIEAMAAGKPVVATRTPGSMEIVDDGRTGLLVPIGDAEALADALVSIMTRPELRSRLGQTALAQARDRYDLLTNIAAFDDHCRSVLEGTPRRDVSRRAAHAATSDRLIAESRSRVAE